MKKMAQKVVKGSSGKNGTQQRETKIAGKRSERDLPKALLLNASVPKSDQLGFKSGQRQVTLRFKKPGARSVLVAGTFNNWRSDSTPLKLVGDGEWILDVKLQPGTYEYLFVVDGQWCDDPMAAERARNPYGGYNAVLKVEPRVILLPDHLP